MHPNVDDSHDQPHAQDMAVTGEGEAAESGQVGLSPFRPNLGGSISSTAAAAPTEQTRVNLESLPVDVWSECLSFLPPVSAVIASSYLCKSLHASSEEAGERAAWLSLGAIARRCRRITEDEKKSPWTTDPDNAGDVANWNWMKRAMERRRRRRAAEDGGEEDKGRPSRPPPPPLTRYASERWMDLYRLLFVIADCTGTAGFDDDDAYFAAGIVLLFGEASDVAFSPVAMEQVASALIELTSRRFGDDTMREAQHLGRKRRWYCSRARIVQAASRLGNGGKWTMASELLDMAAAMRASGGGRDEGGPAIAASGYTSGTKISAADGRQREDDDVGEDGDLADIEICTCSFLVDKLYANTYVRADVEDSNDLSRAVLLGREAVRRSIRLMGGRPASTSDGSAMASADGDRIASSWGQHHGDRHLPPPPPPATMYSSDWIRLAWARLALARALSLLAQHVGHGVTDLREIEVRPLGGGAEDDGDNRDGDDDEDEEDDILNGLHSAESFFLEGLGVIDSSLTALANHGSEDDDDISLDHCEVACATKAARGELLYCAASVNSGEIGGVVLREESDASRLGTIQRLSQSSIDNLTTAFRLGMMRLLRELGGAAPPTVSNLCSEGSLRSLLLLQMQSAKDLGKVHEFAPGGNHTFGRNYMLFAHAVCLRLLGGAHPLAANIERLRYGAPLGLRQGAHHPDETCVDRWINDFFCS